MFIVGRACVSLRKCEAAKRRAHPFNDTALSTTAGSCRSSWAENWQKMQAGDAKMEVPWRISWLQVSGSICKHLHLFWQLHLQSTKEHKRTISALSGTQMEHIETWSWMYWWEETPLLKSTAQSSDANLSDKGLLATAASTISWEWETGNKLQKCPGRLQPKSSA